jgi:hypothetical protein
MRALGLAFLAVTSAVAGAAIAAYAMKKRDDIDRYDFEFDEDEDFDGDDDLDDLSDFDSDEDKSEEELRSIDGAETPAE